MAKFAIDFEAHIRKVAGNYFFGRGDGDSVASRYSESPIITPTAKDAVPQRTQAPLSVTTRRSLPNKDGTANLVEKDEWRERRDGARTPYTGSEATTEKKGTVQVQIWAFQPGKHFIWPN
ncbi:hypothetical protein SEVIR_9G518550v4 [Setaria viridis]